MGNKNYFFKDDRPIPKRKLTNKEVTGVMGLILMNSR